MTTKTQAHRRPALWTVLAFGFDIWLGWMVDVSLEWTVVGCAVMWLVASLMLYRGRPWTGWTMGVVIVFLEVLRYQIDAALSPLPHMIGLGVFG